MRSRDKVAIGWLDPGQVDGMFALSIASIYAERLAQIDGLLRVEAGGLLSRGRCELVKQFLDYTDAQWLLMLDSDMQLSVKGFDKLLGAAHDVDRPIIAGLYFMASRGEFYPGAVPLIFTAIPNSSAFLPILDYPIDTVFPVDSAGTGCLLIHRSVFEKIQADASPHEGDAWVWFRDMPVNGDWFSEDHYFCQRARGMGFPIHAHTGVVLPHRKRFWLSDKQYVRPEVTDG